MKITLKDLRIRSDLSQQTVANTSDLTQPRIANIEAGASVNIDTLERYLTACGYKLEIVAVEPNGTRHVIDHVRARYKVKITDHNTVLFTPSHGRQRSVMEFLMTVAEDNTINTARIGADWENYRDLDHFYTHNNIVLDTQSQSIVRMHLAREIVRPLCPGIYRS